MTKKEELHSSVADIIRYGLNQVVLDNVAMLEYDEDHALDIMHNQMDIFLTLVSEYNPLVTQVRYIISYQDGTLILTPCNSYTMQILDNSTIHIDL